MPRRPRAIDPHAVPTRRQADNARMAIKTSHIVRRLQQNFNGELPEPLTPSQLKSAELLLNRTLPVLSAMEITQGDLPPEVGPIEARENLEKYLLEFADTASEDVRRQLQEKMLKQPLLIDVKAG